MWRKKVLKGGFVMVLDSMGQDRGNPRVALHLAHGRCNLGQIGTGTDEPDDSLGGAQEIVGSVTGQQYIHCVHAVWVARKAVRA